MAEVDTVQIPTVTQPTAGETVATMSKLIKTAGVPTDAAATQTDATSVTHTSLFKQISKTLQAAAGAVATAFFSKITDGTNTAAVKGASSAALATDPALVVAISPNSVNANGQATMANSAPVVIASNQSAVPVTVPVGPQAKAASTPVSVATDQPTIAVSQDTSQIANGVTGTNLTPKFAPISASSSGDNTIVALVSSKKLRVLAWDVKVNAAVNFKWKSSVAGDKTGLYYNAGQGDGVARAFNPVGYFETVAGEALVLNLSGAVAVGGCLTYVEV